MSEWFKVTTSKVVVGVTLPWVRIPFSPILKSASKIVDFICNRE